MGLIETIRAETENVKKSIEESQEKQNVSAKALPSYSSGAAFATHVDGVEEDLRKNTVGLVTLSELKQHQQMAVEERERQIALKLQEDKKKSEEELKRKKKEKKRLKKHQNKNKISFGDDEEIIEFESSSKRK